MMSVDTIGDFLTIIRNAVMVSKASIQVPFSKMRLAIAHILKAEGFIRDFDEIQDDNQKKLRIILKYSSGESVIHAIDRVSKLGGRRYVGFRAIKPVSDGLGISILTTSRGVLTNKQAKKLGVGGEVICTVW